MSLLIVLVCLALLVLLIARLKINAFLAFILVSVLAGVLLGMEPSKVLGAVQKGMGDMLASLIIVVLCGSMIGKLASESGAASTIADGLVKWFGARHVPWALMITGFIIGIPLFYNVGFILVVPLIFTVAYRYQLPPVFLGIPMLASLSVTHGFLPPHPSPTALVAQFGAHMGTTLVYGIAIGLPTVIVAGPMFAKTLRRLPAKFPEAFQPSLHSLQHRPGLLNSFLSALLPVIVLTIATVAHLLPNKSEATIQAIQFLGDPSVVMVFSLGVITISLGIAQGTRLSKIMDLYSEAIKDVAVILFIMAGAGALKQVLVDSGVSNEIALHLSNSSLPPLVLAWLMASVLRVCVGSATVAGLTTAGIIAPLMASWPGTDPNLVVLSIGAGSLMFSHVNDSGFWLFKEYFGLSISQTIRSWSLMETVVAVCGLAGVMVLDFLR